MRLTAALLLALAAPAAAQLAPEPPAMGEAPVVDGRFRLLARQVAQFGAQAPIFGADGAPGGVAPEGAGALIAAARPLSAPERAALARAGVVFHGDGQHLDGRYPAWVPFDALPTLAAHPLITRVECAWRPRTLRPLETVRADLGADRLQGRPDLGWTGRGVRIADLDSAVDVLHPHLFFADGGLHDWVDVDGDGALTVDLDGVDLDGSGQITADEVLRRLPGVRVNFYGGGQPEGLDGPFAPRRDWLYLDTNGSGARDAGRPAGFAEGDLAYGEPLFVAEDTDGTGWIARGEPLHRLGTSKVAKAMYGARTYVRGEAPGIIAAAEDAAMADPSHGTGVASIALGGQWPFHDAVGVAPGAELLIYSNADANAGLDQPFEAIALLDALDEGALLILHEWTDPFGQVQDGGGEIEALMDSARAQGLLQVNPLGNLNSAGKHLERAAGPQTPFEAGFRVDGAGFNWGGERRPYDVVYGLVSWRGARGAPAVTVRAPTGEVASLPLDGTPAPVGQAWGAAVLDTNRRGSHAVLLYVYGPDGQGSALPTGDWELTVTGFAADTTVFGRVTDYYSSWGEGVGWLRPTADRGTLVFPSTADSAVGVAAYGGVHRQDWEGTDPGDLRRYSGRGPRQDGARAVDIAAPDDPFAALGVSAEWAAAGYGRSWFSTFGGTSGAGPHVAGALALLAQAQPRLSADALEAALFGAARTDRQTPAADALPDPHWGHGKLDVWGLLSAEPRPTAAGPSAILAITAAATADGPQVVFDAAGSSDSARWFRFDVDGDGAWDGDWSDAAQVVRPLATLRPAVARVEVADEGGRRAGALQAYAPADLTVPDAGAPDGGSPDAAAPDTGTPDPGQTPDAGAADSGALVPSVRRGGGGGGCAAAWEPGPTPALPLLLLALAHLWRRRRSTRP